jgi:hypothetical protein
MKKKDIIAEIQKKEARFWLELKQTETNFGDDHMITGKMRYRWNSMFELMESLGIESDQSLPDNQKAKDLILKKYIEIV